MQNRAPLGAIERICRVLVRGTRPEATGCRGCKEPCRLLAWAIDPLEVTFPVRQVNADCRHGPDCRGPGHYGLAPDRPDRDPDLDPLSVHHRAARS